MKKILTSLLLLIAVNAFGVGQSGFYQYSVDLTDYISKETGKAPTAYLWVPDGCLTVKAVMFAQQNMTEEMLFRNEDFRHQLQQMSVALLWVAPAFTYSWDPLSGCQKVFDEMLTAIAYQSGHTEIAKAPLIPFGHSAQATMPWNFAAWNPQRTLCIVSFHGDAPRTNLCGYGTSNVEWGRTRNIDGIPGLMIEGEYEWWEARVRPALAFRMMYPESCISFLCDAGSGHFEIMPETIDYIVRFIRKAMEQRLKADGSLQPVNPRHGWLACRYNPDLQPTDGDGASDDIFAISERPAAAPWAQYKGDRHDAFWYFDREMAELTEQRYAETRGKRSQTVGFVYEGKPLEVDPARHGGLVIDLSDKVADDLTFHLEARHTSERHAKGKPRIEVISGPARKVGEGEFRIVPYECGMDNPRRSFTIWLIAIAPGDKTYKRAVQPIEVKVPQSVVGRLRY